MSSGTSASGVISIFLAMVSVAGGLMGVGLSDAIKQDRHLLEYVSQPAVPKPMPVEKVFAPMTPQQRIDNAFWIFNKNRPKPRELWATANMRG